MVQQSGVTLQPVDVEPFAPVPDAGNQRVKTGGVAPQGVQIGLHVDELLESDAIQPIICAGEPPAPDAEGRKRIDGEPWLNVVSVAFFLLLEQEPEQVGKAVYLFGRKWIALSEQTVAEADARPSAVSLAGRQDGRVQAAKQHFDFHLFDGRVLPGDVNQKIELPQGEFVPTFGKEVGVVIDLEGVHGYEIEVNSFFSLELNFKAVDSVSMPNASAFSAR